MFMLVTRYVFTKFTHEQVREQQCCSRALAVTKNDACAACEFLTKISGQLTGVMYTCVKLKLSCTIVKIFNIRNTYLFCNTIYSRFVLRW